MRFQVTGRAGDLPSEVATPLALILAELIQNALEHGFGDRSSALAVGVEMSRTPGRLRMTVSDDGVGLRPGFRLEADANLGLQIVRTLVESELGGEISIGSAPHDGGAGPGGTRAALEVPIDRGERAGA